MRLINFLKYIVIFILIYFYYRLLEHFFGETWLSVGIFAVTLIVLRVVIYFYRKSKGIRDEYMG